MKEFISHSIQETDALAASFASRLQGGEVILLEGELGAGKTAFVKGLAKALGVVEVVTSPTFTLLNEYQGTRLKLYHFDLYRLAEGEAEELGFDEYYHRKDAVCCIEWNRDPIDDVIRIEADYVPDDPCLRRYRWQ